MNELPTWKVKIQNCWRSRPYNPLCFLLDVIMILMLSEEMHPESLTSQFTCTGPVVRPEPQGTYNGRLCAKFSKNHFCCLKSKTAEGRGGPLLLGRSLPRAPSLSPPSSLPRLPPPPRSVCLRTLRSLRHQTPPLRWPRCAPAPAPRPNTASPPLPAATVLSLLSADRGDGPCLPPARPRQRPTQLGS